MKIERKDVKMQTYRRFQNNEIETYGRNHRIKPRRKTNKCTYGIIERIIMKTENYIEKSIIYKSEDRKNKIRRLIRLKINNFKWKHVHTELFVLFSLHISCMRCLRQHFYYFLNLLKPRNLFLKKRNLYKYRIWMFDKS